MVLGISELIKSSDNPLGRGSLNSNIFSTQRGKSPRVFQSMKLEPIKKEPPPTEMKRQETEKIEGITRKETRKASTVQHKGKGTAGGEHKGPKEPDDLNDESEEKSELYDNFE